MADFPHPALVWRPAPGNPLEFLDETYPTKTREMELPYGENFMIQSSTVFIRITRASDGRATAIAPRAKHRALCYAVARKKMVRFPTLLV